MAAEKLHEDALHRPVIMHVVSVHTAKRALPAVGLLLFLTYQITQDAAQGLRHGPVLPLSPLLVSLLDFFQSFMLSPPRFFSSLVQPACEARTAFPASFIR